MPFLKFAHPFNPYDWIRFLVHGLGFDHDFKGWMGEVWKREFTKWFLGLRVEFGDHFLFQTASLDARIEMVGLDHPFDGRMGKLGRKGVLGHNFGFGA